MDTGNPVNLPDLVDNIHTDVNPFLLFVPGAFHPVNDLIGHIHARNKLFHVSGHAKRFGRSDTGKNGNLFIKAHITAHLHEPGEFLNIVNNLGLDKISAGMYLFSQAHSPEFKGIGKGIGGGAKKKLWRLTLNLLTTLKFLLIPHGLDHAKQLDGIHIKHAF